MASTNDAKYIKELQKSIEDIEKASRGKDLKTAIYNMFLKFNNSQIVLKASSIGGLSIDELLLKTRLKEEMESGAHYDPVPEEKSKRTVRMSGIYLAFGDFNDTLKRYDTLIKPDSDY